MSVCLFIASNRPLIEVAPLELYPIEINKDDRPVIKKRKIPIEDFNVSDLKNLDDLNIWSSPNRNNPSRPLFYGLSIEKAF